MPNDQRDEADRQAEVLDVQLLDVFAQIERLLRLGREIQREALRLRGVPTPVKSADRQQSVRTIQQHLAELTSECGELSEVIGQLQDTAKTLNVLLKAPA